MFVNRLYPEPTELQRMLVKEAQIVKETNWQQRTVQEKTTMDVDQKSTYKRHYSLPPQRYADPDDNPNPPTIKTH